jgi:anti-anti-sigma regulatory factor
MIGMMLETNVRGALMSRKLPVEGRLVLTGEMTLQSADAIHARLLEMAGQPAVEIDCGGITEADISLIQLILAARASAERSGRTLTLAQPAEGALHDALERGGFLSPGDEASAEQTFWTERAWTE